jgi:putative PIN family toxin of toxin-antitoxin system
MRVLIDTNVFISYLLNPEGTGIIQAIFAAWVEEKFTLLIPEALLDEILATVTGKPYLAERIPPQTITEFLAGVQILGEVILKIEIPIPSVTRDPKDDYLLAYALVGNAGYLVTGDEDLLALKGQIQELEILTPIQFAQLL